MHAFLTLRIDIPKIVELCLSDSLHLGRHINYQFHRQFNIIPNKGKYWVLSDDHEMEFKQHLQAGMHSELSPGMKKYLFKRSTSLWSVVMLCVGVGDRGGGVVGGEGSGL